MRLVISLAAFLAAAPAAADPVRDEDPTISTAELPAGFLMPVPLFAPPVAAGTSSAATTAGAVAAEPARADVVATGPTERVYGEAKMREAGGSVGFMISPKFHSMTIAPSFGWFIADNVQLTAIVSFTNIRAGDDDANIFAATLEPSYHYRLDPKTLLFGGMGFGWSYMTDNGNGLTYSIRLGAQFEFGTRHLFIPSVTYDFRTNHQDKMPDLADEAAERALRINLGYGTVW